MRGVQPIDEAPCQAWVIRLKDGALSGVAGRGVVLAEDWLYEGGWAFTDTPRSLSLSGVYLGSGAVWDGKTLSLIAPSHTADAVYSVQRPGELFASNSLPFLLAGAGAFDFPIHRISGALLSMKRGLTNYKRCIYSGRQGSFYRFFNAVVSYGPEHGLQERQQSAEVDFQDFEQYRDYLLAVIRQAAQTYGSSGTAVYVSRGYDSVACAALAAQVDKEALALCIDRSRWGDADDGTAIAKTLGLRTVLLNRRERAKVADSADAAEYISAADADEIYEFYIGMGVADECMRAPADLLARRVVLTGFGGDEIWAPLYAPASDLVRDSSDGASLGEFRLRVGFVHIPVPMLGFRLWPRLRQIGLSEAMRPWRVNHRWYDRPVPRRIAEEAGVPRAMFGRVKHAAAMMAVNVRQFAPELFRRLIARYEPAARILNDLPRLHARRRRAGSARPVLGVRRSDKAPAQAWLVRLRNGRLTGVAGPAVKIHRDWLFEGGWACTDDPRSLSLGGIYLGSGVVWDGRTLSLITPSHTADAVYTLERPDGFLASNSLAFLLAGAGIADFPIVDIAKPLASLMLGTAGYDRRLYSGPLGTLSRYVNAIVAYDPRHGLDERQHCADLRFQTFEEYRDWLVSVIREAAESYGGKGMSVYLSRGSSSAACAALAAQVDAAATALCLDRAESGAPDDGTATAKALGLKSQLLHRRQRPKSPEGKDQIRREEFDDLFEFSVGLGLADECLRAPGELLAGRTVLTGFHGGLLWGLRAETGPYLGRADIAGASLGEFRARVGFLHIPVPMLGFRSAARLQAISRSEAMQAWRLGADDDRPIARRLAEEAGVPRLIGQQKQSAATQVASYRKLAPPLFRMLIARYRPAASVLQGTLWKRLRAGLAKRLLGKAARGKADKAGPAAVRAGASPDPVAPPGARP